MENYNHLKKRVNQEILMKRLIWSKLLLIIIIVSGCAKEEPSEMRLTESQMNFLYTGGEKTFIIFSNVKEWTISSDASEWLSITPTIGANNWLVTVIAQTNPDASARSATIAVNGANVKSKIIQVKQNAVPILNVSPDQLNFTSAGGVKTVSVSSNFNWNSTIISSTSTWLNISPNTGNGIDNVIEVTCPPYTGNYIREANIYINITGLSKSIRVIQVP